MHRKLREGPKGVESALLSHPTAQNSRRNKISGWFLKILRPNLHHSSRILNDINYLSSPILALILCSNCSNNFNKLFGVIDPLFVKLLFANRSFPCACVIFSTHGLGISRTALTRANPPHTHPQHLPFYPPIISPMLLA